MLDDDVMDESLIWMVDEVGCATVASAAMQVVASASGATVASAGGATVTILCVPVTGRRDEHGAAAVSDIIATQTIQFTTLCTE
jgi:hypothetical protein